MALWLFLHDYVYNFNVGAAVAAALEAALVFIRRPLSWWFLELDAGEMRLSCSSWSIILTARFHYVERLWKWAFSLFFSPLDLFFHLFKVVVHKMIMLQGNERKLFIDELELGFLSFLMLRCDAEENIILIEIILYSWVKYFSFIQNFSFILVPWKLLCYVQICSPGGRFFSSFQYNRERHNSYHYSVKWDIQSHSSGMCIVSYFREPSYELPIFTF